MGGVDTDKKVLEINHYPVQIFTVVPPTVSAVHHCGVCGVEEKPKLTTSFNLIETSFCNKQLKLFRLVYRKEEKMGNPGNHRQHPQWTSMCSACTAILCRGQCSSHLCAGVSRAL